MESHLQAKGLNIWRVISEGMKNKDQQEKQFDAIAKYIILSSLDDKIFNRVFACENAKDLWKTIKENHEGTKDVANERYHILIDRLNSFKQFDHENAESMNSRLNIHVNEINSLEMKKIDDLELIRKILHSLRRLDYDLVISILYEKELNTFTPNLVLNKGDRPWSLQQHQTKSFTFFTIYSALASKQAKMLKNMVIKGSSSEEGRRGCKPMLLKWWKKEEMNPRPLK